MPKSSSILEAAREKSGETQAAIAEKLGITQAGVSHWETGHKTPHSDDWQEIADAYGLTLRQVTEHFLKARKAS